MLRRLGPRHDRGAGIAEYAGLVVLAALILGGLYAAGVPAKVSTRLPPALCRILGGDQCGTTRAGDQNGGRNGGDNGSQNGGDNGDNGGDQGQDGDEPDLGDLQDQADQAQADLDGLGNGPRVARPRCALPGRHRRT